MQQALCTVHCHGVVTHLLPPRRIQQMSWQRLEVTLHTVIPQLSQIYPQLGLQWVVAGLKRAELIRAPGQPHAQTLLRFAPVKCQWVFYRTYWGRPSGKFRLEILLNFSWALLKRHTEKCAFSRHYRPQAHGMKVKSVNELSLKVPCNLIGFFNTSNH